MRRKFSGKEMRPDSPWFLYAVLKFRGFCSSGLHDAMGMIRANVLSNFVLWLVSECSSFVKFGGV